MSLHRFSKFKPCLFKRSRARFRFRSSGNVLASAILARLYKFAISLDNDLYPSLRDCGPCAYDIFRTIANLPIQSISPSREYPTTSPRFEEKIMMFHHQFDSKNHAQLGIRCNRARGQYTSATPTYVDGVNEWRRWWCTYDVNDKYVMRRRCEWVT